MKIIIHIEELKSGDVSLRTETQGEGSQKEWAYRETLMKMLKYTIPKIAGMFQPGVTVERPEPPKQNN